MERSGDAIVVAKLLALPDVLPTHELFETILSVPSLRIERIVSSGQVSPENFWYDQPDNEWVAVLQGEAELEWENGEKTFMQQGDHVLIKAGQKHRVAWTSSSPPCIWLAVFFPNESIESC